jgi:hypothetical protein
MALNKSPRIDHVSDTYLNAIGTITVKMAGLNRLVLVLIHMSSSPKTWDEVVCLVGLDHFSPLLEKAKKLMYYVLHDEPVTRDEFLTILNDLGDYKHK